MPLHNYVYLTLSLLVNFSYLYIMFFPQVLVQNCPGNHIRTGSLAPGEGGVVAIGMIYMSKYRYLGKTRLKIIHGSFHINSTKFKTWPLQNCTKLGAHIRNGIVTSQEIFWVCKQYGFWDWIDFKKCRNWLLKFPNFRNWLLLVML